MEPFTHALASLIIARAGAKRLPRFGTVLLVTSGVAPDLDYASYLGGPGTFLRIHGALLHSMVGSTLLTCGLAVGFCVIAAKLDAHYATLNVPAKSLRVSFRSAIGVCAAGVLSHILLDAASVDGVVLLWPFRTHRVAFDFIAALDPWLLALLITGLLLPQLFRLVNTEVGARTKSPGETGAAITLFLLVLYLGVRAEFHHRAINELESRVYHGHEPLRVGAFPYPSNFFDWWGVVTTDSTIEQVDVPLAPGQEFDPDRSVTHYKPEGSAALDAGETTSEAKALLSYARFPLASVTRLDDGYRFELRDLRFPPNNLDLTNIVVHVDLDNEFQVKRKEFRYAASQGG